MPPWACVGQQRQLQLLLTAHVRRVAGEDDSDARDLPDPPQAECRPTTFNVDKVTPPSNADGSYRTGPFLVTVPYLDYDQGRSVVTRIQAGEAPPTVQGEVVGSEDCPARQSG